MLKTVALAMASGLRSLADAMRRWADSIGGGPPPVR